MTRTLIAMKYAISVLFALFLYANVSAQLKPAVSYPVSPEVATLGKFVDMPVGTYTGVPDISVPLYTVQYKSISIPLTLSYHAGGIKVDQEATWVGLGWDLFSGGFISQSMIGDSEPYLDHDLTAPSYFNQFAQRLPFNEFTDYQMASEFSEFVLAGCLNDADNSQQTYDEKEAFIIQQYLKRGWGQPDIYSFSFLGRSGKFVLDPITRKPIILQKSEEMKIERLGTTAQSGWRIRTSDGMTFLFELRGTGTQNQQLNTQTWKLTKVTSYDGSQVTFEYVPQHTKGSNVTESYKSAIFAFEGNPYSSVLTHPTENFDYYLSKINTPTETIEFTLANRSDVDGSAVKKLAEIIVKDKISGKNKRSFEFKFSDFVSDETGNGWSTITTSNRDALCKRLRLDTLKEVGYDISNNKVYSRPYVFEYNSTVAFPPKCSFAVDYWGFYNGQRTNNTYLPNLVPLHLTMPDYNDLPFSILTSPYQANRGPSANHMQMGILKKITFPTGGSRVYTFEPHTFSNYTFYDVSQISELPVDIFVVDMNKPNDAEASKSIGTLPREIRVNFEIKVGRGLQGQGLTFDSLKNSTVVLRKKYTNGTFSAPVKTWSMTDNIETRTFFDEAMASGGYYTIAIEDVLLAPEAGATFWVTANLADNLDQQTPPTTAASISCRIKYYAPTATGNTSFYGAGLRISKVELFDHDGKLSYVTSYEYNVNNITTGKLLSLPKFVASQYSWLTTISTSTPPIGCTVVGYTHPRLDRWVVTSGSNISLAFSPNGGFVGYNAVTVNEKSTVSSSINSIVTHEFVNNQNIWRVDFPEMPFLNNGLPTRTTWKTNNGTVLKEELSTYQSLSDSVVYGYTVEDTAIGQAAECGNCGQAQYAKIGIGRFIFRAYAIRSKYYKLTSKVVNDYASTNILSTATDFTYNSQGLLRTESTTNSANDDLSKEYKYPVDYNPPTDPFPDTVVNNLKKKFFLVPVEEKQLFNGAVQKKTLNSFTYNSPAKYVTKTVSLKNSASTEIDFINYTTYSALTGNPIEYKGKNGVNTVILWGRNGTVPIAKIEGATLAQVNTQVNSTSIETMAPASLRTELLKLYYLTNCFVQVYVYDDKAQLIEIIDPTKTSTYFEYDAFGRFSLARDHNKNILANYQYHYIGQ